MIRRNEGQDVPRASWTGSLKFGLVVFPVKAFNAVKPHAGSVRFHQLHAGCHERIRHAKVCPVHGEVDGDEIVSGYEYEKGKFVEVTPEELSALRAESDRVFAVDNFVEPAEIDPVYFDGRVYYLAPDGAAAREPYDVFYRALDKQGRYGVGKVNVFGRDQLALVRPYDGLLQVAMLNYDAEIRHSEEIPVGSRTAAPNDEIELAELLIQAWSRRKFEIGNYVSERNEQLADLLEAKIRGKEAAPQQSQAQPEPVSNLRTALQESLQRLQPSHAPADRPGEAEREAAQPGTWRRGRP